MVTQLPSPKKGAQPPVFGPFLLWPNGWMHQDATWYGGRPMGRWGWGPHSPWIKMTLGMEVRLSPGDFVLDGDPAPPKKGRIPQFSAHVYCGQTAAWIKMPLGPHRAQRRLCARWGPSSPQEKEHTHPHQIFGPCLLWPNGCMDQDATWYGSRPRPRPHCNRRGQSSPRKGHSSPPLFSAHVYCGHGRPSQLLLNCC